MRRHVTVEREQKRILVVDDDMSILRMSRNIISREGYIVDTAETGSKALEKLRKKCYHLAIVNYRLPDIASEELRKIMRRTIPQIRIITLGMKPISPKELLEEIAEKLK